MALLTKQQWRNLWKILFAIPDRPRGDRWGYWRLYALQCRGGKYYIGITRYRDVRKRYQQHYTGKGAKWTKQHRPRRILWTRKLGHMVEADAVEIETETTLQFMKVYGIDDVRGGKLCRINPLLHQQQARARLKRARRLYRYPS